MPFGPWKTFDACMADPGLLKRYPTEDARRKVCGALQARLEKKTDAAELHADADASWMGNVTEGPDYWLIHDAVAAKEGVNDKGEYKSWPELKAAADSLEGAPIVYGNPRHPVDALGRKVIHVDPRLGVGHAVNVRAQESDHTVRYDALLFKTPPTGYLVAAGDVAKNTQAVHLVTRGGRVENSVGYYVDEARSQEAGVHTDATGRQIPFKENQRGIVFGHVALLKPFSPYGGSCGPACALGDASGCGEGAHCCRTRMEAAVKTVMDAMGCTRGAALRLVAGKEAA